MFARNLDFDGKACYNERSIGSPGPLSAENRDEPA